MNTPLATPRPPLAWRNNNPGNLRYVAGINWLGQIGPGEGGFAKFETPEHGFRALARQLMTYKERYGLDSVRKILMRYAPPVENNTAGYIAKVARDMGVSPDTPLQVQDPRIMFQLVRAIADYEDGQGWTWDDETIRRGLRMAGFDVGAPPMRQAEEVQVGAAAIGAASAGAVLQEVAPHLPVVGQFVRDYGAWGVLVLVLVVAGFVALRLYGRRLRMEGEPA